MTPVTEILIAPLKPNAGLSSLSQAKAMLLRQPGCTAVRYSRQTEDPEKLVLFIDWDDVSSHQAFQENNAAEHQAIQEAVSQPCAGRVRSTYHVPLDPPQSSSASKNDDDDDNDKNRKGERVLDFAAVVEIVHIYFPATLSDAAQRDVLERVNQTKQNLVEHAAGWAGVPAFGFAHELVDHFPGGSGDDSKSRVLVCLAGWGSLEARTAFAAPRWRPRASPP
ncbi:hypothetical protein PG993_004118 [Apiospora rasikravindrae]|uniref:ABM domain-containing protein n=1 Tax=Apiospora rasikravindrae TaxID=990691 RepID=A0ABR1TBV7_9PEZI